MIHGCGAFDCVSCSDKSDGEQADFREFSLAQNCLKSALSPGSKGHTLPYVKWQATKASKVCMDWASNILR
jgi:hypothetical protein